MKTIATLFFLLLIFVSCNKSKTTRQISTKWNCIDYKNPDTDELKGKTPAFISHLYEQGYDLRKNNVMYPRYKEVSEDVFNTKTDVKCSWLLSDNEDTLSLIFPSNSIEKYLITEQSRTTLTLKAMEGLWANSGFTYLFEKD
jgi:hypothetical protein